MPDLSVRLARAVAPRYELLREIASGGMGTVYLAHDPALDRDVAIKVLAPEGATAVAIERFLRESRLLARMNHPNIVPIIEAGRDGPLLWFVMPVMAGNTLAAAIARGPMPVAQVRRIASDLIDALTHAHGQGVVHRDVKPANVFLQDGRAVLGDFGVAALHGETDLSLTHTGASIGTPRYMAPEQLGGDDASAASDLYSTAATLFELCSGVRWRAEASTAQWKAVPRQLRHALRRALDPRLEQRWPDAPSLLAAIVTPPVVRRRTAVLGALGVVTVLGGVLTMRAGSLPPPVSGRSGIALLELTGSPIGSVLVSTATLRLERFLQIDAMTQQHAAKLTEADAGQFARLYVTGAVSVDNAGSGAANIVIRDSTGTLRFEFVVAGTMSDSERWAGDIADSIVAHVMPAQADEYRQLTGASHNAEAHRLLDQADSLFRSGDGPAALTRYRDAIAADPSFMQARWGQILALQWLREPFATQLDSLAMLLPVGSLLHDVVSVQRESDPVRRLDGYTALVRKYPGYLFLRQLHANELFSRGPLVGRSLQEGLDLLSAVARMRPASQQVDALTHVVWGAIRLGDHALADSASRLRSAIALPHDRYAGFLRLAKHGRFDKWRGRLYRQLAIWFSPEDLVRVTRFGLEFDNPVDQLAIARRLGRGVQNVQRRVDMLGAEAAAHLALGQPNAALSRLAEAAALQPDNPDLQLQLAEWTLLLPAAGVAGDGARQAAARSTLTSWSSRTEALPYFILAVDGLRRADTSSARVLRVALAGTSTHDSRALELADLVDAYALGLRDRPDSAIAQTARAYAGQIADGRRPSGAFTRALLHLWRAKWFEQVGDRVAAGRELLWHENSDLIGWPAGVVQQGEVDAALGTFARVLRADLLFAAGADADACRLAKRSAELLSSSETSQASWRQRAHAMEVRCR